MAQREVASEDSLRGIALHSGAPASLLAPFTYSRLIWAIGAGFLVFGGLPDQWTRAGAAVIVARGLYTAHRERVRHNLR